MIELSGCGTTAATATTGSFLAAAKIDLLLVGDREVGLAERDQLQRRARIRRRVNRNVEAGLREQPFVARVVEADVIRIRRPVERQRDVLWRRRPRPGTSRAAAASATSVSLRTMDDLPVPGDEQTLGE